MEGRDCQAARLAGKQHRQPVAHLLRRAPGKGECQACLGGHAVCGDIDRDPVGERARLAGPRPRDDHQRPGSLCCRALVRVETRKQRRSALVFLQPNGWRDKPGSLALVAVCGSGHAIGGLGTGARRRIRGARISVPGFRGQRGEVEQRSTTGEFFRLEQADHAVFAVVAGLLGHLTAAEPADCLTQQAAADPANVGEVGVAQDGQFRSEGGHQAVHLDDDALTLRAGCANFADDLRKGDHVRVVRRAIRPPSGAAIGEFCHPVQHSNGERLLTLWAHLVMALALPREELDPALTVPIQVITATFGKEVEGPGEPLACTQPTQHRKVVKFSAERGRFPAKHRR